MAELKKRLFKVEVTEEGAGDFNLKFTVIIGAIGQAQAEHIVYWSLSNEGSKWDILSCTEIKSATYDLA